MSEFKGVWVFSENHELALELLSKGRELADKMQTQLTALLLGSNVQNLAQTLVQHGADKVVVVDKPQLKQYQAEPYLTALTTLAKQHSPDIILFGSTRFGKELAARLATRLETACVPDCTKLSLDNQGNLMAERIVYGGNAAATIRFHMKPQIATIPARTFEKPVPIWDRTGQIEFAEMAFEELKTEIVEIKQLEASQVKIEEARMVICGGRGVEKKEDFKMLDELAQLLGGQVGNTRPLAEDRKWFSEWVGLSGHKIKPTLYIGCGVSGVIQHVAGIRDSQIIVAINKDAEAPLCEVADYVIVGNLYDVIPALIEALKKELKTSSS
ncbi:MAG: electron transfer flavoprotein subunit alpha/FixB family protein [Candidatus Bathyarchaeia archaeon]|nr:electron transfer flavoprotein subunit alpha/FixB family protein [Candidatus Bathyarchaeota archaeon A05DMB-4]MDH7595366.1 electron transfer flavoprotein subunit alpha/FixB family protein [Candidatus Bathyarchaeota archaeon]